MAEFNLLPRLVNCIECEFVENPMSFVGSSGFVKCFLRFDEFVGFGQPFSVRNIDLELQFIDWPSFSEKALFNNYDATNFALVSILLNSEYCKITEKKIVIRFSQWGLHF